MLLKIILIMVLGWFPLVAQADKDFVKRSDVQEFINHMVKKYHFNKAELTKLFENVKIRPKVIQSIKAPLEKKPWSSYQSLFVTDWRIREGVKFWNQYQDALARAEKIYGVPASVIVATIGVETKYGRFTGEYPVIDALTNIAFGDTGRNKYFKNELVEFLLLTREQHLNPREVMGSYAGAIGQPQFMPSSYRYYAVNFSGSGKIDLSHNEVDVIGSIANYYKKHAWKTGKPIVLPSLQRNDNQLQFIKPTYREALVNAGIIPSTTPKYRIVELQGVRGDEYWLGFHNFDVIKRYNASDLYAMAVYQLSYYIAAEREKTKHGART